MTFTITAYLESDGIPIYSELYLPEGRPPFPAVCICHGIPARPADPSERGYPVLAETICREGFAALIFNFRGCGLSGGNFDIEGWVWDARLMIDYLRRRPEIDPSRLTMLGFSGGAAVAVYLASSDTRVGSVISGACPAEFSFFERTSPEELIRHFRDIGVIRDAGFPGSIQNWLEGFKIIKPVSIISRIAPRPLLILHGAADDTVPVGHAHRLYAAAGDPKRLVVIPGAGHRLRQEPRAVAEIIGWLKNSRGGNGKR